MSPFILCALLLCRCFCRGGGDTKFSATYLNNMHVLVWQNLSSNHMNVARVIYMEFLFLHLRLYRLHVQCLHLHIYYNSECIAREYQGTWKSALQRTIHFFDRNQIIIQRMHNNNIKKEGTKYCNIKLQKIWKSHLVENSNGSSC